MESRSCGESPSTSVRVRAAVGAATWAGVAIALSLPHVWATEDPFGSALRGAVALGMFAPWYWWLLRLPPAPRPAGLGIAFGGGFFIGAARAWIVMGWIFRVAASPWLALVLGCFWSGIVLAVVSVAAWGLLRLRRWDQGFSAALAVLLLDKATGGLPGLPVPYLTSVFAVVAALPTRVISCLGWEGIAGSVGLIGLGLARCARGEWRGPTLASGIASIVLAGLLLRSAPAGGPPAMREWRIMAFRSGTAFLAWSHGGVTRPPEIVVLPEEAVVTSEDTSAEGQAADSISLAQLEETLKEVRCRVVVAGLWTDLGEENKAYRNSVIVIDRERRKTVRDKTVAAPGGESVPFANLPWLGRLFRDATDVEEELRSRASDHCPVLVGDVRLATSICYEHLMLNPSVAWGVRGRGQADLLVAIGDLERLGPAGKTDLVRSRPARRLHAAVLGAPLVYVTERGMEWTRPDGESHFQPYAADGTATISLLF